MKQTRLSLLGIAFLLACMLATNGACTQQDAPTPTLQATDLPQAAPTLEPTGRAVPPPTIQPVYAHTAPPEAQATYIPEALPDSHTADSPTVTPTIQSADAPLDCVGLFPTNTPDPNRPESIRNWGSQDWPVSSYEEVECITGYPIYTPTNLPDGFIRAEQILVSKRGSDHFENRWVEHGWYIPGDPGAGFRLQQHSRPFGIDGESFTVNGRLGERLLTHPQYELPPLLSFLWEEDGYWFTIWGFLDGPITEEFLLEVAASLELRDAAPATHTTTVSQACSALGPTNTPDPNRPEGILGRDYQFWNVSSFEEAECITDYPIAIPTNLPDGFIRGENIIVSKRSTSHFEDRWVEHGWGIPGDPSYGFRVSQHSWKFSLGNGEPTMINGIPGERSLRPAIPPDFPPLLTLLWEEEGYWYTVMGFLDGPITEEFLLEVAASLRLPEDGSG